MAHRVRGGSLFDNIERAGRGHWSLHPPRQTFETSEASIILENRQQFVKEHPHWTKMNMYTIPRKLLDFLDVCTKKLRVHELPDDMLREECAQIILIHSLRLCVIGLLLNVPEEKINDMTSAALAEDGFLLIPSLVHSSQKSFIKYIESGRGLKSISQENAILRHRYLQNKK